MDGQSQAELLLRALPQGSKPLPRFAILDECTFRDERKNQWVSVDKNRLEKLAKNLNARVNDSEGGIKVIPGHTVEGKPEEDQPRTVGFICDFNVEPFRNPITKRPILKENGEQKYALYATPIALPGEDQTFRKLNRRSPELWLDPDDIDPLALLGATTPRRDLGQHIFQAKTPSGERAPIYFERRTTPRDGAVFFREIPDSDRTSEGDMPEPITTAEAAEGVGKTSLSPGDIKAIVSALIPEMLQAFMMSDTGEKLQALANSGAAATPEEEPGMGDGEAEPPPGMGEEGQVPTDGGAGQGLEGEEEPTSRMAAECGPTYMGGEEMPYGDHLTDMMAEAPSHMAAMEHGGHFWGEEPGWENDEDFVPHTSRGQVDTTGPSHMAGAGMAGYSPMGPSSGFIPGYEGRRHHMQREQPYTAFDPEYDEFLRWKQMRAQQQRMARRPSPAPAQQQQTKRPVTARPGAAAPLPVEIARNPAYKMMLARHQAEREADRKRIEALELVNREASVDAMLTSLGNPKAIGGEGLIFDFDEEKAIVMKFSRAEDRDNYYASMCKKFRRQEDELPNGGQIPVSAIHQAPRPIQFGRPGQGRQDAAGNLNSPIQFRAGERFEVAELKAKLIYEQGKKIDDPELDDVKLLQRIRGQKTGQPVNGVQVS